MKIGIISFAHIHAESYASCLKGREDIDCIGFFDDDSIRGQEMATRYGIPFFNSLDDFFNQEPEAVIVCSENSRHRFYAEKAADHGCPVLCEKPLATTVDDARAMVHLFKKKDILLMTAFPMRYSTPVVETKAMMEKQGLGEIYCVSSKNQGRLPRHLREWFVDKELAGGGAVADHVVHLTDIFRWVFQKEVSEVYARSNRNLNDNDKDKDIEVETGGLVMLTMEGGPFISIDCSWSRPQGYPSWGGLSYEFIGEKGNIKVNAFKQTIQQYSRESLPQWQYWGSNADSLMIDNFVKSIRGEESPRVSGYDGLKAVEVVQGAYRSIQSGQTEKI